MELLSKRSRKSWDQFRRKRRRAGILEREERISSLGSRRGILRNISADQTIQLSVRERNSCLLGGEVVTHLVNSHEMFTVWRSYNFKDLKADLSQQEQGATKWGTWEAKCGQRNWRTRLKYSAMICRFRSTNL